ncbi:MAG: cytochrome B [Nitrospinae bacterium RIFCSPLOWO2_12_FULL_45_22]|nr:MAG: cytochrome B [Nitrospinae bacterium RIFCSPLOWO2_12_FULL_45_22]
MLKKLYHWVLHWADTPYGSWALALNAFSESSFFPIPPDALLIAMGIAAPKRSLRFAFICSLSSVLGGIFGYYIGLYFMELIGFYILNVYGFKALDKYHYVQQLYQQYDAWAVGIAGFTPIPYKVFTIAAGAFKINFAVFVLASVISRSARFYLVAGLLYWFGEPIKTFIDKYFNLLSILFIILLILGFLLIRWVL